MIQFFAEWWPHLVDAIYRLVVIAGGALLFGLTVTRKTTVNPEEIHLHKRQKQGGTIFNELLREMRERENRSLDKFVQRLAAPDVSETDRRLYAEEINTRRNQIDSIDRMLMMKEPD